MQSFLVIYFTVVTVLSLISAVHMVIKAKREKAFGAMYEYMFLGLGVFAVLAFIGLIPVPAALGIIYVIGAILVSIIYGLVTLVPYEFFGTIGVMTLIMITLLVVKKGLSGWKEALKNSKLKAVELFASFGKIVRNTLPAGKNQLPAVREYMRPRLGLFKDDTEVVKIQKPYSWM